MGGDLEARLGKDGGFCWYIGMVCWIVFLAVGYCIVVSMGTHDPCFEGAMLFLFVNDPYHVIQVEIDLAIDAPKSKTRSSCLVFPLMSLF